MTNDSTTIDLPAAGMTAARRLARLRGRYLAGNETDTTAGHKAAEINQALPPLAFFPPGVAGRIAFNLGLLQAETGRSLAPTWDSAVPGPLVTVARAPLERILAAVDGRGNNLASLAEIVACDGTRSDCPEESHNQGIHRAVLPADVAALQSALGGTVSTEDPLEAVLREALHWCKQDADNEDGYPTQEMLENRVAVLKEALGAPAKGDPL